MTTYIEELPNYEDYSIVRIDVFRPNVKFSEFTTCNAALILEDENGNVCIAEFIELDEFADYFPFVTHEECIEMLEAKSIESTEDIVEFSVEDGEIIQHFEHFRTSKYNISKIFKEI